MLTKFLITWIVAFFVLCLPLLLFVTTKDREAKIKMYNESYKTNSDGSTDEIKPLSEEYYKLDKKVNRITAIVMLATSVLNIIFLISLPYIIDTDFNFPFHYNTYVICLFIIIFLYILLNLLYPPKSPAGVPFLITGGGNQLIVSLIAIPFIPGFYIAKLFDPTLFK